MVPLLNTLGGQAKLHKGKVVSEASHLALPAISKFCIALEAQLLIEFY